MKKNKNWLLFSLMFMPVVLLTFCTKNNQILTTSNTPNGTTVTSMKTTVAPTIDGTIDPIWQSAEELQFSTVVPDPGNQLWYGFIGEMHTVKMKSMYDDQNVYFLFQWDDPSQSVNPRQWYFDPVTKTWNRENSNPTYDVNGVLTRQPFGEDKIALLWNINNSTPGFATQTCYASCHMDVTYSDTVVATGGNMATNNINEKLDQWELKLMENQGGGLAQCTDGYQDYAGGKINANGRHTDGTVSSVYKGPGSNTQSIKRMYDTTGVKYSVPKYVNLTAKNYNYIMYADTGTSNVVTITAVDTNGVLYYNGGTIDPRVGTDFQHVGAVNGPRAIPYYMLAPLAGGADDITARAVYTGSGWIVEMKRAIKTGDVLNQDIDFTGFKDQPFAVGIFNNCGNAHGVAANLLMKFKK